MEKVENLYRTARAQNDSIDTSEHIGSRLRDSLAVVKFARFRATRRSCGRLDFRGATGPVGALAETSEQSVLIVVVARAARRPGRNPCQMLARYESFRR